jgi:hypothetical protein
LSKLAFASAEGRCAQKTARRYSVDASTMIQMTPLNSLPKSIVRSIRGKRDLANEAIFVNKKRYGGPFLCPIKDTIWAKGRGTAALSLLL